MKKMEPKEARIVGHAAAVDSKLEEHDIKRVREAHTTLNNLIDKGRYEDNDKILRLHLKRLIERHEERERDQSSSQATGSGLAFA